MGSLSAQLLRHLRLQADGHAPVRRAPEVLTSGRDEQGENRRVDLWTGTPRKRAAAEVGGICARGGAGEGVRGRRIRRVDRYGAMVVARARALHPVAAETESGSDGGARQALPLQRERQQRSALRVAREIAR